MHLVTDNHPSSIVVFGEAGHYRWFNKVSRDRTGLSRQALFDKPITSVIGPAEGRKIERWVQDCLAAGKPMTVTHSVNVEGKAWVWSFRNALSSMASLPSGSRSKSESQLPEIGRAHD